MNFIVHEPTTPEGKRLLSKRVASVHAQAVDKAIGEMNCSPVMKAMLFEKLIEQVSAQGNRAS